MLLMFFHRRRGVVLPAILLVTVVLVVLSGVLISSSTSSLRSATLDQNSNQAIYAAEAGLAVAVEEYSRTLKFEGSRRGELRGASYEVMAFINDDIGAKKFHGEGLPPNGLTLPPSTMYLLCVGTSENGIRRRAGALFRTGLEAIDVGVLSKSLEAKNSEFHAYNSTHATDPRASEVKDTGLLASNRTDPLDTTAEFDLADTKVEGGVYVAPHSTPKKGILPSGTTTIAREGVLSSPIVLDEIVVPDIAKDGTPSEDSENTETPRLPQSSAGGGDFLMGDLYVKWTSGPTVGVTFVEYDNNQVVGSVNLSDLQARITQGNAQEESVEIVSNGDERLEWNGTTGQFDYIDPGDDVSGLPSGELLELLALRAGVRNVENPDQLYSDREYETVTINESHTTKLPAGTFVVKNLDITAGGKLELEDGPAVIYVTESLTVEGENALLNSTKLPPNLKVYYTGDDPVRLSGGSQSYFTLIAPEADLTLTGALEGLRTSFFGALVGKTVKVENADFYFDLATKGIGTGAQGFSLRLLSRHRL